MRYLCLLYSCTLCEANPPSLLPPFLGSHRGIIHQSVVYLSLSFSLPSPLTVTLRKDIVTAMHFPTMLSIAIDMCFVVHDRIRSSSRAFTLTRGKNATPEMGLPPTATVAVANGKFWPGMKRCTLITAIKPAGQAGSRERDSLSGN